MSVPTLTPLSSATHDDGPVLLPGGRSRPGPRLLGVAALSYSAAWLVALAVAPSGATVSATGRGVLAALEGHLAASTVQYLAAEVVAGLALVVTLLGVASRSRARGRSTARVLAVGAVAAGALSVVQGALGVWLTTGIAPAGDDELAATVFRVITRADGLKMLVLAVLATAGVVLGRRGALPRPLTWLAGLLAVTLAVSGVGYLLLADGPARAAYLSLPVLLVWVTGSGLAVLRRERQG